MLICFEIIKNRIKKTEERTAIVFGRMKLVPLLIKRRRKNVGEYYWSEENHNANSVTLLTARSAKGRYHSVSVWRWFLCCRDIPVGRRPNRVGYTTRRLSKSNTAIEFLVVEWDAVVKTASDEGFASFMPAAWVSKFCFHSALDFPILLKLVVIVFRLVFGL